jgi:hypothetical protein
LKEFMKGRIEVTPDVWQAGKNHAFCRPHGLAEGATSAESGAADFPPDNVGQ